MKRLAAVFCMAVVFVLAAHAQSPNWQPDLTRRYG